MRRIAPGLLVLAALSCGCQSMQTPWDGPKRSRAVEATHGAEIVDPATTQPVKAVSDATMIGGQGGFGDSPSLNP